MVKVIYINPGRRHLSFINTSEELFKIWRHNNYTFDPIFQWCQLFFDEVKQTIVP